MSAADLQDFLAREFADISALGIIVERVDEQTITLRLPGEIDKEVYVVRRLHAEGSRELVADASITYSIPPRG